MGERDLPLRAGAALLAVAALALQGCSDGARQPRSELVEVERPDLSGMDPETVEKLTRMSAILDRVTKAKEANNEALGRMYGESGMLYHAYALLDAARDCYVNAHSLAPQESLWSYYLGRIQAERGDNEQAIESFRRVVELQPDYISGLVSLGEVELDDNRLDEAEASFRRALEVDPDSVAALYGLGRASSSRRDYAAAVEHFETALLLEPRATVIYYPLGLAYRGLGEEEKARQSIDKRGVAKISDPPMNRIRGLVEGWRAHLTRGSVLAGEGYYEQAAQAFRAAVQMAPEEASARANFGSALFKLGDLEGARREFEEAIRLDPREAKARFNLGTLSARVGNDERAVEHYRAALDVAPQMLGAHFNMANALRRLGKFDEALPHYRTVIERNPGNATARQAEIFTLIRLHRYAEAARRSEAGLVALPEDRPTRHALVRLLAAAPDGAVRDGERALEMSQALVAEERSLAHVEAAAMAAAESGRFDLANQWQERAIEAVKQAGRSEMLPELEKNLESYRRGEPCRRPWPDDAPLLSGSLSRSARGRGPRRRRTPLPTRGSRSRREWRRRATRSCRR